MPDFSTRNDIEEIIREYLAKNEFFNKENLDEFGYVNQGWLIDQNYVPWDELPIGGGSGGESYTKDEIDEILESYPTKDEIEEILGDYCTKDYVDQALANYYTKDETDELLDKKLDKEEYQKDQNIVLQRLEMLKNAYELLTQRINILTPSGYIKYDEHGNPTVIYPGPEREQAFADELELLLEPLKDWDNPPAP